MISLPRSVPTIALALVALGSSACMVPIEETEAGPSLTDTVWELQQIQYNNDTQLVPEDPADYTIEFLEGGDASIKADCNQVLGSYTEDGSSITIELGPSTLAACAPESIDTEYLQALESAAIYFFRDGDLYIDMIVDTGTIQFSAAE